MLLVNYMLVRSDRMTGIGGGSFVPVNNVQKYREARMMSRAELARRAGLSTLTIDRVEAGRPCRLDTKRKILQALEMKISEQSKVFGLGPEGGGHMASLHAEYRNS